MGGKRKQPDENYSSRSEILSKSRKPRNVCANVILAQTDQKIGCQERRFSRKLLVPSEPNCLVALVQLNDICMMVSPIPVEVIAVKFNINVVPVSGKKKKGAVKVGAGDVLCTVELKGGATRKLTTPVGGQVLELNHCLEAHPELLSKDPQGTGYIGVVFPDTELPDFHNFESWKLKEKLKSEGKFTHGCCHAWIAGTCKRGISCKFTHIDLGSSNADSCIVEQNKKLCLLPCSVEDGREAGVQSETICA